MPVTSKAYGKVGVATNKTESPKQRSTNPVSNGFKILGPTPFLNASMCGTNGCGKFPQATFATHPVPSLAPLDTNFKVKQPLGLFAKEA